MATRNTVESGLWSAAGTWDTPPVDGDAAIVGAGHIVTFDADMSAYVTGIDLTVTGTLQCTTTPGSYYFMASADIKGAGSFFAGVDGDDPLPADVSLTIDFTKNNFKWNAAFGGIYCYPCKPVVKWLELTAQAQSGQAVLQVDRDASKGRIFSVAAAPTAGGQDYAADDILTLTEGTGGKVKVLTVDGAGAVLTVELNEKGTTGYSVAAGKVTTGGLGTGCTVEITAIEGHWKAGDSVGICDFKATSDSEKLIIQSIDATSITLTTNLAATKEVRSLVGLLTRNIKMKFGTSGAGYLFSAAVTPGNKRRPSAEITCNVAANVFLTCRNNILDGATVWGTGHVFSSGANNRIKDCVLMNVQYFGSSMFAECVDSLVCATVNCTLSAGVRIIRSRFNGSAAISALSDCSDVTAIDSEFTAGNDLSAVKRGHFKNCKFSGTNVFANAASGDDLMYVESSDHQQVPGDWSIWTSGGVVTNVADPVAPGRTKSFRHALSSAEFWCYKQERHEVVPDETIRFRVWLRQSASLASRPCVQLVDVDDDPFETGGDPLLEEIMADVTDTWEEHLISWRNDGNASKSIYLRVQAMNATSYAYALAEKMRGPGALNHGEYFE